MLIFNNKAGLKTVLSNYKSTGLTTGFVPTMGALHEGHLSLLQRSVAENDLTVISIFVNPTQFNNPDDLKKYPRTLEADVEKIKQVSDSIIIFAPSVEEMYDGNTASASFTFDGLENEMEGSHRPGHFDGVGTIVKKLFEAVEPTRAYFGEKDFQQLQIVKKLVEKLNIPVDIVGCPISREPNGLARSSRNERLTLQQKEKAAVIYRILKEARQNFSNTDIATVKQEAEKAFAMHPEFSLDYFEIADEETLVPAVTKENRKYRAFVAVFFGNIRLIDNISLN